MIGSILFWFVFAVGFAVTVGIGGIGVYVGVSKERRDQCLSLYKQARCMLNLVRMAQGRPPTFVSFQPPEPIVTDTFNRPASRAPDIVDKTCDRAFLTWRCGGQSRWTDVTDAVNAGREIEYETDDDILYLRNGKLLFKACNGDDVPRPNDLAFLVIGDEERTVKETFHQLFEEDSDAEDSID